MKVKWKIHNLLYSLLIFFPVPLLFGVEIELLPPIKVEANGQPIDVDIGHAAPFITDFDGDGKFDLTVGQFGGGKLRIYQNIGNNHDPVFNSFTWLQAGKVAASIPSG